MRPFFSINVDGTDITNRINNRLISLSITDNRGMESDQLTLDLDDSDGKLEIPRLGAIIKVAIGWSESGLIDKGIYIADEIGHTGPADKLSIQARSTDLRSSIKSQREKSYHNKTLGDIIKEIAAANGLSPVIHKDIYKLKVAHIDQTSESDAHFLTRLAQQYDALATVKDGKLIFTPAGLAQTVGGNGLPLITIKRFAQDQHHYQHGDREKYTGVKAIWYDKSTAKEKSVLEGDSGTTRTLQRRYPTEAEARAAAKAEMDKLSRGQATMSLTLAIGRPEIITESPAVVSGFKPQIDSQRWVITNTVHTIGDDGLKTQLEMENLL